jgi:hypothetical protein
LIFDHENDELVFSTGKRIYANRCIIGLSDDVDEEYCRVSYGYDGGIAEENLTASEKIELADYMITLWTDYRNSKPKVND